MHSERCEGGHNSECQDGHEGPLCSVCKKGWYKSIDGCQDCAVSDQGAIWRPIVVLLGVLVFVFGTYKLMEKKLGKERVRMMPTAFTIVLADIQIMATMERAFHPSF